MNAFKKCFYLVKHFKVIFRQRIGGFFRGDAEILQNNRNVHVHHDEEGHHKIGTEKCDSEGIVATISVLRGIPIFNVRVAVGRLGV